jgi:xanthine dehydrogenase accessory factor
VRDAAPGSVFVVLTHDHGLDFLIAQEALARGDAAYVGMIGSKTKRATFKSWLDDMGYDTGLLDGLTMPIGGADVDDKRPEVIAALTAAEIVRAVAGGGARG